MRDSKLELRNLHASHTLGCTTKHTIEIPQDKDEVNKQDIHDCDGRAHDPGTMVAPLTPKPKRKAETLDKAPPTIDSHLEEDVALLETKGNDGIFAKVFLIIIFQVHVHVSVWCCLVF